MVLSDGSVMFHVPLLKMQREKHPISFNGILPDILCMQLCVYFLKRSNQLPIKEEILHLELELSREQLVS